MEKMSYANTNQKNAGVAVLALDKAGLEPGEGKASASASGTCRSE